MAERFFLGVDVGTHETKGVLINEQLRPVAEYALPHKMENPKPGYYEMDAMIWWEEFCAIARKLLGLAGAAPCDVAGVGVSVMGCDCIPVDESCNPLRKAILYGIDARSAPQIEALTKELGEEGVIAMFGHVPHSDDVATKILWVREEEPEVYGKTYQFLTGSSFMAAKLTGNYTIDSYLARVAFRPIYRQDGSYNTEDGPRFCREDQVPQIRNVTDVAGTITETAAKESGLCPGTPVIVGTGDSTAESVAGGLLTPGTLFVQLGSTIFFVYCVDREMKYDPSDRFPGSGVFTIPGSYAVMGGTNCAGALTAWVRDLYYQDAVKEEKAGGISAYQILAKEAAEAEPGSKGLIVLPYLYGERSPIHDPLARGVLFGLTGDHSRKEIARAALEGVACSLGSHMRLFKKHGLLPDEVIIAGGGTRNPVWMQIMAEVIGLPVKAAQDWQTASYGDACMAAIGCGMLKDFKALKEALPEQTVYYPDMENHKVYEKYQDLYEELYLVTAPLMHKLSQEF